MTAIIAAIGVAIVFFAVHTHSEHSGVLAVLGLLIGPYFFVLWLRSAKTHFVLTNERALRFVGNNLIDDFGWRTSESPILLEHGQLVSDPILAMERKMWSRANVCLRLRAKRPFSWKRYILGGDRGILPIPNRLAGPSVQEVFEISHRAWLAAQ
ncbi:MAG: hypothetical protein ACRCSU_04200 [Paracoccaceae bacterium]